MSEPRAPYDGMSRADPTARLARRAEIVRLLERALARLDRLSEDEGVLFEGSERRLTGAMDEIREARRLVARL